MSDFAEMASGFWSDCVRLTSETASKSKAEQAISNGLVANVTDAVKNLTIQIQSGRISSPTEVKAHVDAIESRKSTAIGSLDHLRRAIGSTQLLDARFSSEIASSVDAVRTRMLDVFRGYTVAVEDIARQWSQFSVEADSATGDQVATVRKELAQLDRKKAGIAGDASSTGERSIREAEQRHTQEIEAINASMAPTFVSRPYHYWGLIFGVALSSAVTAAFIGAAGLVCGLAALVAAGTAWSMVRWLDSKTERKHAERKASRLAQAESSMTESIRRISREQEAFVRTEIERIAESARQLQRDLEAAIGNLTGGRERAQVTARELLANERTKLERSWVIISGILCEVTQLFDSRHGKALAAIRKDLLEQVTGGLRKCQSDIDAAAERQIGGAALACRIGSRDFRAPEQVQPYLEAGLTLRVPLIVDLIRSCYIKHDSSRESIEAARRLASWHAMELWMRTGAARVTIFDTAGLGAGYSELLSVATEEDEVTLFATSSEVSGRLSDLVRTVTTRNRSWAVSRESDWMARRAKVGIFPEPAEVLILEIPRSGFGSEQCGQIGALLNVGWSAGVILIVLDGQDSSVKLELPKGSAREVEFLSTNASEKGHSLSLPTNEVLVRQAVALSGSIAERRRIAEISRTEIETVERAPKGPPTSSFSAFVDAIVPEPDRWRGEVANAANNISIPVGVSDDGEIVNLVLDDRTPHALLLGGSGSGKTNFLHTLIQAGCIKFSPDELHLYLADLKNGVSFEPYARLDSLARHFGAVACTSSVVFGAVLIDAARQEMQRRYEVFKLLQRQQDKRIVGLADYRALASPSDEKLPRLLVIIDEFQALFNDTSRRHKTLEHLVTLLKQGRQVGVHVILATQSLQGRAGDLDQALSQIHTRMILQAAMSDAGSIFKSSTLAARAVDYCDRPGRCFISRDFGEKVGIGFVNPESRDNSFFFGALNALTMEFPVFEPRVPVVWGDEVGSLKDSFEFRSKLDGRISWFVGVPYSANHTLVVPLDSDVLIAAVAVEEQKQARALVGSLLISLLRSFDNVDVYWIEQGNSGGPLRRPVLESMLHDLAVVNVQYLDSLRSVEMYLARAGDAEKPLPRVVVVPDATLLTVKPKVSSESEVDRLISIAQAGFVESSPDIEHLISISSSPMAAPTIVLLLASSCHDLMDGAAKAATDLAGVRIAGGQQRGSRLNQFLRVSDLTEMTEDDLVVTTKENRRPKLFRPFEEQWSG